jgi:hypothetical protein
VKCHELLDKETESLNCDISMIDRNQETSNLMDVDVSSKYSDSMSTR